MTLKPVHIIHTVIITMIEFLLPSIAAGIGIAIIAASRLFCRLAAYGLF
ncbi:hypothetical protein ACT691_19675 [Vibrio metschnikovii]